MEQPPCQNCGAALVKPRRGAARKWCAACAKDKRRAAARSAMRRLHQYTPRGTSVECKWCGDEFLTGPRHKYCSGDCAFEATRYAATQAANERRNQARRKNPKRKRGPQGPIVEHSDPFKGVTFG